MHMISFYATRLLIANFSSLCSPRRDASPDSITDIKIRKSSLYHRFSRYTILLKNCYIPSSAWQKPNRPESHGETSVGEIAPAASLAQPTYTGLSTYQKLCLRSSKDTYSINLHQIFALQKTL